MDRALPSHMVDLIRDGVRGPDLRAGGTRAVYHALVRTAMSVAQRGWTEAQWRSEILSPTSTLGQQVRVHNSKSISEERVLKTLRKAWNRALRELATRPEAWTPEEVASRAERRAKLVEERVLNNPTVDFGRAPLDREILRYAVQETKRRKLLRIPIPWRALAGDGDTEPIHPGMTERRAKAGLVRLVECHGLLLLEARGKASGRADVRRANLYSLFPAEKVTQLPVPGNPAYGTPRAQTYGTSARPAPMGPLPETEEDVA